MNWFVERKSWIYVGVGTVVAVVAAFVVLWIYSTGGIDSPLCTLWMDLSEPVLVDGDVWQIEVENITGSCPVSFYDLEETGVILKSGNTTIIKTLRLNNGLVAHSGETTIFFADNGKIGRVDKGDVFYIVNLSAGSEYNFGVLPGGGGYIGGHVYIHN